MDSILRHGLRKTEKNQYNLRAFMIKGGKILASSTNGLGASDHAEMLLLRRRWLREGYKDRRAKVSGRRFADHGKTVPAVS